MLAEDRRATIVAAARRLVVSQGAAFTTREVAQEAGIAEGTIFRVFASKDELMAAVVANMLNLDPLCERIAELPPQPTLLGQVQAILACIGEQAHGMQYVSTVIAAMSKGPHTAEQIFGEDGSPAEAFAHRRRRVAGMFPHTPHQHGEQFTKVQGIVEAALAPYRDQLAMPPAQAASWILLASLATAHPLLSRITTINPDDAAQVIVHGIAKE
jgi:AcrR family transcriptional regulator